MNASKRIYYIDNLRIFLIALVVLHHLAITYGGPGSWYYIENKADALSGLIFSMFLATNQSFFMALFFFISAYFIVVSISRKGAGRYAVDRLIRLGIPLLGYYVLLSPLTNYILVRWQRGEMISFPAFVWKYHGFGFGPMWFVEALLYFNFIYLGYYLLFRQNAIISKPKLKIPGIVPILIFTILLGIGSFTIRIWLPVGWEFRPFGFQFPFFLQYISYFIVGLLAFRYDWLNLITYKLSLRWFLFAQVCIFILFPVIFVLGGASSGQIDLFFGGRHWQSFAYALWEQTTGISLILGLAGLFKYRINVRGKWAQMLSASSYTVFIIHPLVLVLLTLSIRNWHLYPLLKFILVAPFALLACFITAILIKRLPFLSRIL
jgi:peptidoglycan/LPS O-acetylase OafA/YrhL